MRRGPQADAKADEREGACERDAETGVSHAGDSLNALSLDTKWVWSRRSSREEVTENTAKFTQPRHEGGARVHGGGRWPRRPSACPTNRTRLANTSGSHQRWHAGTEDARTLSDSCRAQRSGLQARRPAAGRTNRTWTRRMPLTLIEERGATGRSNFSAENSHARGCV